MTLSPGAFERLRRLVIDRLGLGYYDRKPADLERRFRLALEAEPHSTPEAFLDRLLIHPDGDGALMQFASHFTVGETYFFRDSDCMRALQRQILPSLLAARREAGLSQLRIWSAGCSTGEEPYTLAMMLDTLLPDRSEWNITVLATDINANSLEVARRGRYRWWSMRSVSGELRQRYFRELKDGSYELDAGIRSMVTFAPLNLAEDRYPSARTNTLAIDLLLCRNVLMYFSPTAARAVVLRFQQALSPGGYLLVSPVEASPGLFEPLVAGNFPDTMAYVKRPHPVPERIIPQGLVPDSPTAEPPRQVEHRWDANPSPVPDGPPPKPENPLRQALALADQGRLAEARCQCEAALAKDPLDTKAHMLLANICEESRDLPAAVAALRRALYSDPDAVDAHFALGTLLLRQGAHKEGRRSLETVIRLLNPLPPDELVPGGGGLTAGRILETAQRYLGRR
ncbi:MAG TPA: CheR family methyltransferase [Symbiobacteriaceae bacterium]|nr:CheR family methyltransferase [Symbiobacteriaceae bacterium]